MLHNESDLLPFAIRWIHDIEDIESLVASEAAEDGIQVFSLSKTTHRILTLERNLSRR